MGTTSCFGWTRYVWSKNGSYVTVNIYNKTYLFLSQSHFSTCAFNVIPCPNRCSVKLTRKDLPEHLQHDCPKRKVKCEFCGSEFTGEAHEVLRSNPIDCYYRALQKWVLKPRNELALKSVGFWLNAEIRCLPTQAKGIFMFYSTT